MDRYEQDGATVRIPPPLAYLGALLLGLVFNVLNFENGRGTISFSAYWQMVIRGGFLFVVILFQARVIARHEKSAGA